MPFKTIYKVPQIRVDGQDELDDSCFVEKGELQRALRRGEEYLLAYFLKTSRYQLFPDFPWAGQQLKAFRGSIIEGPREEEPEIPRKTTLGLEELELKTITKPILKRDFPSQFQHLELRTYGLDVARGNKPCNNPYERCTHDVDFPQFEQLSVEAVRRAQSLGQRVAEWEITKEVQGNDSYLGCLRQVKDNLLLVSYHKWGIEDDPESSRLVVKILGLGPAGEDFIQALNLQGLGQVINDSERREFYLYDSREQGLAYNFSLEQLIRDLVTDEEGERRSDNEIVETSQRFPGFLEDYKNVIL